MYDIFKTTAEDNGFHFTYARRDFQNLFDELDTDTPALFVDPIQITDAHNEYNQLEGRTYEGTFMLLISSDIEDDYMTRYLTKIKPVLEVHLGKVKESLQCGFKGDLRVWRTVEAINIFDYNLDGILCTYQIYVPE